MQTSSNDLDEGRTVECRCSLKKIYQLNFFRDYFNWVWLLLLANCLAGPLSKPVPYPQTESLSFLHKSGKI